MEDAKIIELFWERNEQAVKETDTAYGRKLYVLSNNILNNREDAEERKLQKHSQKQRKGHMLPNKFFHCRDMKAVPHIKLCRNG